MSVLAQASYQFGNSVFAGAPRSNDGSNHANDKRYHTLRDQAHSAQAKHVHFAAEASKAYKSGDKAEASALSQKSKQFQAEADRLNEEAAAWVFRANNTDSAADEIDLHGLFVKEAIIALDARIEVCRQHNQPLLKAIVGKGLHSETHIAKLRPAVMDHCKKLNIPSKVDTHNPGVVLIAISEGGAPPSVGPQGGQQHPGGYSQYNAPSGVYAGAQQGYGGAQQGYAQPHGQQQGGGFNVDPQTLRRGVGFLRQIFGLFQQCLR